MDSDGNKEAVDIFYPKTRNEWRKWLMKNHAIAKNVNLVILRKHAKSKGIRYEDAVQEALCFGWIDSTTNKRDEETYVIYFAPRKSKSNWSTSNHIRVANLIKEGRMTPAGQAVIDHAKKAGTWKVAGEIKMPEDLHKALMKNNTALSNFNGFSPSAKQIILGWIVNAKRPDTRLRRINKTVELAAKNLKPY